jgi:outer membrane protein assembly factor BamB
MPTSSRPRPTRRRRTLIALAATGATVTAGAWIVAGATGTTPAVNWTVYHGTAAGTGSTNRLRSVITSHRAWTSTTLDGNLYVQPVTARGRVFVATENNTVYALAAATGKIIWSHHIAAPVPAGALPCGNVAPTVGITGTPVIDTARGEIFVVADEYPGGRPTHVLVGLSTATGAIRMTRHVDPPHQSGATILQRTGLNLDRGRVVFGFGGNYGDCGQYRGRVVTVPEGGGTPRYFTVAAGARQRMGAVWMGGAAPEVDSRGNIWVGTGNGSASSSSGAYDHSDSVLKLSSSLRLLGYFAPSSWRADNAADLDLSMAPALVAGGKVVGSGKSAHAYLLNQARPGGIGHPLSTAAVCGSEVTGGAAVVGTYVYLPCLSGPVALRVSLHPAGMHVRWSAGVGGGPPIVAANRIWTIGQDGVLYGLDPRTGAVRQSASVGSLANHFPTPGLGAGLMLVGAARQVVAFHTS